MQSLSTLIEIATRWLRAAAQGSTLLGLFMIGLVWAGLSFHQEVKRSNAERAAVKDSDNLARAFEEHLARSLKDIDRSLKIMRSRYLQYPDELDFRDWLRESHLFDDQTVQVAIIDPDGLLRLSSVDTPSSPKTDLGDREHFRAHLDAKSDDLFISKPVGRTSGKWSVQLTRRIENADGSFGGVVVASLDPMYLARFYSSVDIGNDGYISVVGADGIVRAAGGHAPRSLGLDLSRANLFKHYPKETTAWYYNASNLSDHIPRLVTFRAVKGYPLIVTVGLSAAEIFSEVYAERHLYNLFAIALTLLILVVIGLSMRGHWLRERMAADLNVLAHHDPLTGLLNRARFNERLDEALVRIGRGGRLAVLLLDLDRFKEVNDTHGHLVGDELLKEVADRLRGCVREIDFVARFGGDEFAIIETAIEHPADISALADRIRSAIRAPFDLRGLQAVVDVSIGISLAPDDAISTAELMKQADLALYKAKGDGRGVYRFFQPDMRARVAARRELELDLRRAIVDNELELLYQPIVDIEHDEIVGLEALLRWRHPARGLVLPAEFISVAEESGLIVPIGEWAIRQACGEAARWPGNIKIAVNISPAQLRADNLPQVVIGALAASGVQPCRLELEITEGMLLEHGSHNLAVLEQLRQLGVRIVMDDFGIGYSALSYLGRFRFDRIKIACPLGDDLSDGNALSLAVVQAAARFASALAVPATAEGVDTAEQLELVRAAGCTEFQGYLFCPPRPAKEIARLFQSRAQPATSAA